MSQKAIPPAQRSWPAALRLYLKDANKLQLILLARKVALVVAGTAPVAILDDALAPFTFGLTTADDFMIPVGLIIGAKVWYDVRKYRSYDYQPRR